MQEHSHYDVVIIGAGPAGLSAARTLARLGFETVVVERSAEIGQMSRPCSAILTPLPGLLKGRRLLGDLFYPQLDLLIPLSMVVGYPRLHRFITPGGHEIAASFSSGDGSPVAAIDKGSLLRLLAEQAQSRGAQMMPGTEATGLLLEAGQIKGVQTNHGAVRAGVVLAAEGVSRRLSRAAGLFPRRGQAERHALILSREMLAPGVRRQHLGQITTFGQRFTSAREAFGTVVMPAPGRASVFFTLLSEGPQHQTPQSARFYLDEYVRQDPRVSDLLAGASTESESATTVAIHGAPQRVARTGFLSLGDAATPAGHVGILGAMWLGRQAALVAADALDADDVSGARLSMYGHLFHNRMMSALRAERQLMLGLAQTSDPELDRLAQVLNGTPLAAPFFTGWQGIPWEAARWLTRHYPDAPQHVDLLQRILDQSLESAAEAELFGVPAPDLWQVPFSAGTTVS